ncbi:hypothetical protein B0H14DRAFT_2592009 [Mycena olivaceomarginata]|nr:hypothetical protein B0H14DRAFT_2592009 [Mycena olivaceomarginata]
MTLISSADISLRRHPEYGNKIPLSAEGSALIITAAKERSKLPLSYYTPVSGTVTAILARLTEWQMPLELLRSTPPHAVPNVSCIGELSPSNEEEEEVEAERLEGTARLLSLDIASGISEMLKHFD